MVKSIKKEWPMLKGMILGSYKNLPVEKLCKKVITFHGSLFQNFMVLCKVALCMTLTSVEFVRTFSTQNRLKSKHRSSLLSVCVDTLMNISMCGPSLPDFNPIKPVQLWYAKKKSRKGRLSQEYNARKKPSTGLKGSKSVIKVC